MQYSYILIFLIGICVGIGAMFVVNTDNPSSEGIAQQLKQVTAFSESENIKRELEAGVSLSDEARLKRQLAETTMPISSAEGYRLLREVAGNTSYPAIERALAEQLMGDVYLTRTSRAESFFDSHVLAFEPYTSLVPRSTPDTQRISLGVWELYKRALSLAVTPISAYRISQGYLRNDEVNKAYELFQIGNDVLERFPGAIGPNDQYMVGHAYWLKGLVAGDLGTRSQSEDLKREARMAYEEARRFLKTGESASQSSYQLQLAWADLYFAKFLQAQGYEADKVLIDELLSEIVSVSSASTGFTRYLQRLALIEGEGGPRVKAEKEAVMALARTNTDFAQFLESLGFKNL